MDDESDRRLLEKIQQYHNSILKHSELKNDSKILSYIKKLYDMPVTVEHLKETGIGRTMNALRKYNGHVGIASKTIVNKWKLMVAQEEDSEYQDQPSSPVESDSPADRPSSPVVENIESPTNLDKYSKYENYKKESNERSSKSENSRREDRHHKEEKKDSHKSSHSKEKDHRSRHDDLHQKHRKDDQSRHENKRKRPEEEQTSSKRLKYETHSSESEGQSDENMAPDSTTRENSPFEKKSNSSHKKHQKSDKHEKHRHDKNRKEMNGSHSSKKSSHKDKESKHSSNSSKKDKSRKEKDYRSSSSGKSPEKSKKIKLDAGNGIDSGSGASFAEALGMIEPASSKSTTFKKKSSHSASPTPSTSTSKPIKSSPSTPKPRTQSPLTGSPNLLSPNAKLEPLDTSIVAQLPEITTNYKPHSNNYDSSFSHVKNMSEEEALSVVITSKSQRTKVYSGNKTNWGYVPTLFNLCVRVLQDNIDALEYTGGVPYIILKPVLERATANQLLNTEYFNPYIIEESDELWELHCKRECKGLKRQEMESWRDMYLRCRDERDAKLKALTVNIKQSIDKSLPVRQTKLAYVDSVVKPPRGVARKQAKYGTMENLKKPLITPSQRLNSIAAGSSGEKISVPNPGPRAMPSSSIKPKKAPLMQKTLALMKGRFGRR